MTPFIVGIDLGTTNCAVAFVDVRARRPRLEQFRIPQLVEHADVQPYPVLPSFLYLPEPHEADHGELALPWDRSPDAIAGVLARARGALLPGRVVTSAKSWLAHPGVDRRAAILPWGAESGPRISPVDASARYLRHIRDAWNTTVAATDERLRLERQRIVLTVPASFDEEPRELTVEAARAAGFDNLTLIEEPVAAFYAWMSEHRRTSLLERDRLALVCDVGGGTSDFSLIRVHVEAGAPAFERVAIGDHLLLGGDNVDLALAALVERRIAQTRPDTRLAITQRAALRRSCSAAKERLLAEDPPERIAVTVLGAGRALVGDAITTELTRQDVEQTLNEFLPVTARGEVTAARDHRAGLRELGLPYETDPAITRHLASFLLRAAAAAGSADDEAVRDARTMVRPDLVLFNGGFFTPPIARERIVQALVTWFGEPPEVLTTSNPEAAVALGAATYGRLRAGIGSPLGIVKAGSGRAYYIGVRAPRGEDTPAVCVLARGTDEATEVRLDHPFTVTTNRPVSFALYSSTLRSDRAGDVVTLRPGHDTHQHAPLVTVLRYGRKSRQVELPVRLSVVYTELGTLELWCDSQTTEHRWRLQFQLRTAEADAPVVTGPSGSNGAAGEDEVSRDQVDQPAQTVVADEALVAAGRAIRSVFEGAAGDLTPENLVAFLEQAIGYGKTAWPLPAIRRLSDVLIEVTDGRRRSAAMEARWLNLFGFCLRPGLGAAKDSWRIGEARKIYAAGLSFPNAIQNRVEWLVLWQRVAGGFSAGQQRELAQRTMGELGLAGKKGPRLNPQIERESWRLLASLERLEASLRQRIGDELVTRIRRDSANQSLLWAIGRLGARIPLYGPLSSVVQPSVAMRWIDVLLSIRRMTPELGAAIVQIAARTEDPLRDLDASVIDRARSCLIDAGVSEEALRPLREVVETSAAGASQVFGEPLPDGLRLEVEQPAGSR